MVLTDISLIVVALFFGVYGVFCALEGAVAISLWQPKWLPKRADKKLVFTPLWELSNVFLVFAFSGFLALFGNSLSYISPILDTTISIAIVSVLARAALVLWLFYNRQTALTPDWAKTLFVITSLSVPLSLTAAGIYLLTGEQFFQNGSGWLLAAAALLGVLTVSLAWLEVKRSLSQILFGGWLLIMGLALPLRLETTGSTLLTYPFAVWLTVLGVAAALILASDGLEKRAYLKYVATGLLLVAPAFLVFSNRPYFISHRLKLDDAFSGQDFGWVIVIGLIVILPLLLGGFWAFASLLEKPSRRTKKA